jgi:hypothetical protein
MTKRTNLEQIKMAMADTSHRLHKESSLCFSRSEDKEKEADFAKISFHFIKDAANV